MESAGEDAADPLAEARQETLDGPAYALLDAALVERAQAAWDLIACLEVLGVGGTTFDRPQVGDPAQRLVVQRLRHRELASRPGTQRLAHEIAPNRQRVLGAVRLGANLLRLIEPHPHAADDRRREADEPGVLEIVGGARLSANWRADAPLPRRAAGAVAHDVLEHRHQL